MTRRHQLVVFSDLDGTLLHHDTYAIDAARPALEGLGRAGVPLVLCTSKTRAEVEPLRAALDNDSPFVVENGGAVCIPHGYFSVEVSADPVERNGDLLVIPIGDSYSDLVAALARASRGSGVPVRGFSEMTDEQVAATTGLSLDGARLARQREFDEPFEILDPAGTDALLAAIEREGKRWTAGGRFHHITGRTDKGAGVRLLVELYRRQFGTIITVGLGDAANDVGFLGAVDNPIVMASPHADEVARLVPRASVTRASGPTGWNDAVLGVLERWS